MGFDNECILNIESLAGEYFCPVCRTLVYPNEAIQSQCTHLYCKPCLTYVVGTTHACPYDGYLVTEADSKPLIESNKALAETIGKIVVRCLYHRSGCSWQGALSDCTSHCPGCSFGNSPVVCNRCGVQIVHRQVQEHAQTCSGVNPQAQQGTESVQDAANTGTASGSDQSRAANQAAAPPSSQVQSMPAAAAAPPTGQVLNQQTNVNPPVQAAAQGGASNPEQWYQQQYQQNYQQYPGYDQYQQPYQQYYPYQQIPTQQFQPPQQPQLYPHPQPQPQPQLQPLPNRPQMQGQPPQQPQVPPQHVQPHNIQAQVSQPHQPPASNLPPPPPIYPQSQPHLQPHPQHVQVPQYQQPHSQMQLPQPQARPPPQAYQQPPHQLQNHLQPYPHHHQPQPSQPTYPNAQPQNQPISAHAVTGNHSYPQVQANQQMHPGPPQQPPMHIHGQFPQQPPQMPPHSSALISSNQQESALVASQGQLPSIPPHLQAQQPGYSVHQRPVMQQIQQPVPQQYVQQPFQSQPQQYPLQSQLVPPGPPYPVQQNSIGHLQPQVPQGVPTHQPVNYGGRPVLPNQGQQLNSYPQSTSAFGAPPARPMTLGLNQPPGQLNYGNRTNNQPQVSSDQQFVVQSGVSVIPSGVERKEGGSPSQKTGEKGANALGAESIETKGLNLTSEIGMKEGEDSSRKVETPDKNTGSEVHVAKHGSGETSDSLPGANSAEIAPAQGEDTGKVALEKVENSVDDSSANTSVKNDVKNPQNDPHQNVLSHGNFQTSHPGQLTDQGRHNFPTMPHQQGPGAPSVFQSGPTSGSASNAQLPGYPSNTFRPQGPGHFPQPGQPGPFHPNAPVSGFPDSNTTFGKGPGHFGHPQDNYNQGHPGAFDPRSGIMGRSTPHDPINPRDSELFPNERQNHVDRSVSFGREGAFGQSSGVESNMQRFNGANERFKDPFLMGPNRSHDQSEFEKGPKRFPRPSHEGSPKFGSYFDNNNPQHGGSPHFGAPSHFLPPYHSRPDAGERPPVGFNENNRGRIEPYGFGRHHMETSRSPGRDYLGIPPRGFGVDLDGQDMRGPHKLPSYGTGTLPNHIPLGESYGGNNPGQPRFGEPGFRSSYSLQEFPDDGRFYAGETDSFDNMRRKPFSTGWCRICKVDCETVEGLDMHSQTREHQKVTMDMVINIKRQNTKKQNDHSSFEERRKQRNPSFKNRGAKPK